MKKTCLAALAALILNGCSNPPVIPPNKYQMGKLMQRCNTEDVYKIVGISYYDLPQLKNHDGEVYKGWIYHLEVPQEKDLVFLTESELCYPKINSKYGTRSHFR